MGEQRKESIAAAVGATGTVARRLRGALPWLAAASVIVFVAGVRVLAGPPPAGDVAVAALQASSGAMPVAWADAPASAAGGPLPAGGRPRPLPGPDEAAPLPGSAAEAVKEQQLARGALRAEIGRPPLAAAPDARPAYVSALEWQALQAVARAHDHPPEELRRLVNYLRFNKLLEAWRTATQAGVADGDAVLSPAARRTLGEQLLGEVPARVLQQELTVAAGRALQRELLAGLEPDPAARARRAAQEAARLQGPLLQSEQGGSPAR